MCPCQFCSAWMCYVEDVYKCCNCDMFSVVHVYIDHCSSGLCVLMVEGMSFVVNVMFVFDSVYVDLQHDEISLTFTAGFVCCLWLFGLLWSVCDVVLVPYVDAVLAVTVASVFGERV